VVEKMLDMVDMEHKGVDMDEEVFIRERLVTFPMQR